MLEKTQISNRVRPNAITTSCVLGYAIVGLLAISGWVGGQAIASPTSASPTPAPSPQPAPQSEPTAAPALEPEPLTQLLAIPSNPASQPLPDGTYLYGQSPHADTIGATYMVFDVNDRDVVGAFYSPYSSFDCFRGSFQADELALTIQDSYEQNLFTHTVSLVNSEAIASTQPTLATQHPDGFYPITELSEMDQHILATCRAQRW